MGEVYFGIFNKKGITYGVTMPHKKALQKNTSE
jgi:hypothetical protein